MRRNGTSFLIAVMLAAATWACDQAAPTTPTPVAAVNAGPLATSSPSLASSATTDLRTIDLRSAKGGKPDKPDKPKPPPPEPGGTAIYMATVTFGGETSTATTPIAVDVGDDALHIAFSAFALPQTFVATLVSANCFDALSPQPTAWFHISEINTGALSNSNKFNARLGGKDQRFGLELTGAPTGTWFPEAVGETTTISGHDWAVKKLQGKNSKDPCADSMRNGPMNWSVSVKRMS